MSKESKFGNAASTQKSHTRADSDIVDKPSQLLKTPLPGKPCPKCKDGILDYDGLLNLICIRCGYILAGCST